MSGQRAHPSGKDVNAMIYSVLGISFLLIFIYSALNIVRPFGKFGLTNRRRAATVTTAAVVATLIVAALNGTTGPGLTPTEAAPSQTAEARKDQPDAKAEPAPEAQPAAEADETAEKEQGEAPAGQGATVTVLSVVDGDTFKVEINGKQESVRLIGVDTPETVHPSKEVQPYGPQASAYTKQRLTGQQVRLEFDAAERDQYGRLLAYAWLGDEMYNATLIREGYAQVLTVPPNVKYVDQLVALQKEARAAGRGLWAGNGEATAPADQPATQSPTEPAAPSQNGANGADKDCGDFATQAEAQAFFEGAGGPAQDPHKLDKDGDGLACETN